MAPRPARNWSPQARTAQPHAPHFARKKPFGTRLCLRKTTFICVWHRGDPSPRLLRSTFVCCTRAGASEGRRQPGQGRRTTFVCAGVRLRRCCGPSPARLANIGLRLYGVDHQVARPWEGKDYVCMSLTGSVTPWQPLMDYVYVRNPGRPHVAGPFEQAKDYIHMRQNSHIPSRTRSFSPVWTTAICRNPQKVVLSPPLRSQPHINVDLEGLRRPETPSEALFQGVLTHSQQALTTLNWAARLI